MENRYFMNIEQVRRFLPHRAPFLLIDRVLEIQPQGDPAAMTPENVVGTKVTAIKNFTYNEPFVPGHFPDYSIVPGVILIETMAQAASFSIYPFLERVPGGIEKAQREFQCILVGVDSVRFRKPVIPGDTFRIESEVTKIRGRLWGFKTVGLVDGKPVAEAELLANLVTGEKS